VGEITRRYATMSGGVKTLGLALSVLVGLGTVGAFFIQVGVRLAEREFLTVTAAKERDEALEAKFESRIVTSERLAAQREAAIVLRLEEFGRSSKEANDNLTRKIDNIYNLLLQGRR
jgi:hypothetical protein